MEEGDFREIFRVESNDIGIGVKVAIESPEDEQSMSLAIVKLYDKHPMIALMVAFILKERNRDPNFRKIIDEGCMSVPDFNEILNKK